MTTTRTRSAQTGATRAVSGSCAPPPASQLLRIVMIAVGELFENKMRPAKSCGGCGGPGVAARSLWLPVTLALDPLAILIALTPPASAAAGRWRWRNCSRSIVRLGESAHLFLP